VKSAALRHNTGGQVRSAVTSSISRGKEVRDLKLRKTFDIIEAVKKGLLPDEVMINTHPQRWTDDYAPWMKELVWQNMKLLKEQCWYTGMLGCWNKNKCWHAGILE